MLSRFAAACLLLVASGWLTAAEPTVRTVNVRGLQVGGTTTIAIDGDDLGTPPPRFLSFQLPARPPKLLLPFPAKQTLKPGFTDKKAEFEVTLADDVPPGLYHLRAVTEGGASLPVVVGVDRLTQKPFGPTIEAIPAAVHGTVSGATVAETTFTGKANEKVTVEVEAQRIGSKLRPVLHLYTAKKLQLAWAWGTPSLGGDTRLEATLPADGTYTISLHDAEYAGPAPGHFRLKVGNFGYVDQVFPPVAGKDTKTVELIGSAVTPTPLPPAKGNVVLLDFPKGGVWSGPRPWVEVSSRPEFVELPEPGKVLDLPEGRVAVSGKLTTTNEEDRFKVAVKPKSKVRFEVFAERLGSPVDAALFIRNETGGVLTQAEDSPGTLDPVLEYTVPDKVTSVVVGVADSAGRGGPRGVYRLVIDPVKGGGLGDFRLVTPTQRLSLAAGGKAVVPVFVDRRGYAGKIDLLAEGLPAGVKLEGTTIPPDADGTLVIVSAGELGAAAITNWKGKGDGIPRDVVLKGHPLERLQPWLATELSVSPTSRKAADFTVDWRNIPADAGLSPAGKLAMPVTVKRLDPAAPVRFVLLTSQNPPLVNNQPDAAKTIRPERPQNELAAKAADGDVPVLVPAELPADSYQIAVQAELLSADKQKVLATAVTPVKTFSVKLPVAIKADAPKLDVKLDAKTPPAPELKGTVERLNGFAGDIQVSLTGLPAGVAVPAPVTVKAGETKFAVKLTFPPTTPPGESKLKLSASVAAPTQPNVRVKGRDIEVTLNVIAAPK